MKRRLILGFGVCLFWCAGLAYAGASIFNPQLLGAYQHYQETLSSQRDGLLFESGKTANNCLEYLRQKKISGIAETVNNRIVSQEYLVCDSVVLLKQSATRSAARNETNSYGKELWERLDLRAFPSSLRQLVDDNHFVLSKLKNIPVTIDRYSVTSETDDWLFKIEVVAEFDRGANGTSDWLLWLTDAAKKGNYRSYNVLIVGNPSRQKFLRAHIVP